MVPIITEKTPKYIIDFLEEQSKSNGMTILDILENISNNNIKINKLDHLNNIDYSIIEEFKNFVYDSIEKYKRLSDNLFATGCLYRKYVVGELIQDFEICCDSCGRNLGAFLYDEQTLCLISKKQYFKHLTTKEEPHNYKLTIEEINNMVCTFNTNDVNKLVSEINVPTGKLIFANYFTNNEIYKMDTYNNINSIGGRNDLMQYLATKDIGYGQMGNMSINVFKKLDGTEIIIGSGIKYDDDDYEQYIEYDGFINIGMISLDVWRWQCGDLKTLKKYGEEIPKKLKETKTDDYKDFILANVKPGKWIIEHYYDFQETDIYSKLYLTQ